MPVYNAVRWLPAAVRSLFDQDFTNFELIVVDDGSTEDVQGALRPFADQLRYIYQANAGSAVARNRGLAVARGEFIAFLDSDDLFLPGKLSSQLRLLQDNPDVGMAHSGWQRIDAEGNLLETVEPWHAVPTLDLDGWVWHKPVRLGASLIRKTWLDKVGGFDPELRQSQDVDLMLRLALAGITAVWHYRPTMAYRVYPQSTIRRHAAGHYSYVRRVLDKLFSHPDLPGRLAVAENKVRYYNLRWLAVHIYSTGAVEPMMRPLTEAAANSPHSPVKTMIDWAFAFARSQPFTERMADEVWPLLVQAIDLPDHEWGWLEGLLTVWLANGYPNSEDDLDQLLAKRPFW